MAKEYIEREVALKDIEEMRNKAHEHINITGRGFGRTLWAGIYKGIDLCRKILLDVPTANVVPVRCGRWINNNIYDAAFFICDQCCAMCDNKTNYCPNCGAKMREEQSVDKEEKHEM